MLLFTPCALVQADAADRGAYGVVATTGSQQGICEGLLIPLAHEVAQELIVKP